MGKRLLAVTAMLLAVGLMGFAAGCGDDDEESADTSATTSATTADSGGGGGTTSVEMTEYEFIPNDLTVTAGDTITAENTGQVLHNLTIAEGESPEDEGQELAATPDVDSGGSGDVAVDVGPGRYSIICTIPGHAEQGMTGTMTVE